jgi:catechol 2,3-dioxygenase-like lactoylglutathione lyase family enzyme
MMQAGRKLSPWLIGAVILGTAAAVVSAQQSSSNGRMVRPRYLIHIVPNLEKSIAFYHEGLNLEAIAPPAPLTDSMLVRKAVAANPSAKAMSATLAVPGADFQLLLIQFSGIEAKPFKQHLYDPGITRFSIQVRDIDKAFNQVKDRGVEVPTTSAGPVYTQRPRNNTRAVMMNDPDGFVFEFVEPGAPPKTDVPESSNIYNARSSLAFESMEKSIPFYRDILGFTLNNQPAYINDAVLALEGTPRARVRSVGAMPPGSNNMWVLWEFNDIDRTKHVPNVQDPGASALSLQVENLTALVGSVKSAGLPIETPGGETMALEKGHRAALVRSPDGLLIELYE